MMPAGRGSMRMQISPVSPVLQRPPSSRCISTSYRGTGLPMEPERGVDPTRFATVSGVSVCPKPS